MRGEQEAVTLTEGRVCTPMSGSCALLSGHVGPHHGYPENIDAVCAARTAAAVQQVEARVLGLADKWMREQAQYPPEGAMGAAAVRLCAQELRAAALSPNAPAATRPTQGDEGPTSSGEAGVGSSGGGA